MPMVKSWLGVVAGVVGSCGLILRVLEASEMPIRPARYPWGFNGIAASFDHSGLRRGWQVYRTVCHACHSLRYLRFGDLIEVTHTEEEVKRIAAEFEAREETADEEGVHRARPARPSDLVPEPYPSEEAARAANFGAYPPDLTYAVQARRNGSDYIFSLLTGWMDPPAGLNLPDGQHFNVYFAGGATGMPQMLQDGILEYDDGTPATQSQMAKDVTEFLTWTSSQEHDARKLMTLKGIGIFLVLAVCFAHFNRRNWSHVRTRRIAYTPRRAG